MEYKIIHATHMCLYACMKVYDIDIVYLSKYMAEGAIESITIIIQ